MNIETDNNDLLYRHYRIGHVCHDKCHLTCTL
jgi:hypothetical protein